MDEIFDTKKVAEYFATQLAVTRQVGIPYLFQAFIFKIDFKVFYSLPYLSIFWGKKDRWQRLIIKLQELVLAYKKFFEGEETTLKLKLKTFKVCLLINEAFPTISASFSNFKWNSSMQLQKCVSCKDLNWICAARCWAECV